MPRYDPVDDILSNRRGSEFWQGTLAQLAQIPQMLMQGRAQADAHRAQAEERQANTEIRRGQLQLQQRQLALSERAQEMEQGVQMLVSQAMEDGPDGTKRFNRSKLMQGFAKNQVPLEMQQRTFASLDAVDESLGKFEKARLEHAADVINAALEAGGTPEIVMAGLAYGKANGWLKDTEIAPIYERLASDEDVKPFLKQMRDSLTDKYRGKAEGVVVPSGGSLVNKQSGAAMFTAPTKPESAPNVGSFEDYVVRKYGQTPTPEQITEARKVYQQADDRPIRINTGNANLTPNAESAVINRLANQWTAAAKPARELERQVSIMDAGMTAARRGDLAPAAQAVLVTFQKILDPGSVVRESEFDRSAAGQSLMNRAKGAVERLTTGGAGVPLGELEKFATLAREIAKAQRGSRLESVKERLGKTADRYKIPRELVFESESADTEAPSKGASDAEGWVDIGNGVRVRKKR